MTHTDEAYALALEHLRRRQQDNGAFAGEVIWNAMLPCQYVILCHIVGHDIPAARRARLRLQLERTVTPEGGWGMHPGSPPWMFHTALAYVALRLLGASADDPLARGALAWLRAQPTTLHTIPTWGRVWLAILGLYPWSGVQPILPELWLLPDASPMHPSRLYCHMRLIYLGLSYLYGTRFVAPSDAIVEALRAELYPSGYDLREFEAHRDDIAATDLFEAPPPGLQTAFAGMRFLERFSPKLLRERALRRAVEHMRFEVASTDGVCLSPVNGFLFCLAFFIENPRDPDLAKALQGMDYWVWEDDTDGTRFCGARSDIWDTSFLLQALCEGPRVPQAKAIVEDAARWLPRAQMLRNLENGREHYRDPSYGGWGFANEHHPWPVSDCTAEALEALLRCEAADLSATEDRLPLARVHAAIEFVLRRQNDDGGFGSYESRRGPMVLKQFNPAEIYGNCMLEYSYTECTGSCVRGLVYARERYGDRLGAALRARIGAAVDRGATFLRSQLDPRCGAWLGFWGINVTYGTFFAVSGLVAAGVPASDPAIRSSVRWLLEHQRPDGGWAESWDGMREERAIALPEGEPSLVVQTAWAVLTLLEVATEERAAIDRGIGYLLRTQSSDGAWPREVASGCFFNTAVLEYDLYRDIFPTWALARYHRVIEQAQEHA